ncbi:hypothetical protein SUGI_1176470 [Cryptomeria japonica]|uniref:agamous-like MADS-box protein AGL21 n=1 Tax=Cryptomeria japonica TaxID=3369 RepID=UPI0024146D72|nr:agamous-like MADS-box protein AGL21 [Cryptomeria japonica]GLJ54771.1 hypothetical protein SUGI_1176470 [Cryptomeria japonica]
MGRRKLLAIYRADKKKRRQTFLKRKKGLLKKAHELSLLCGSRVIIIIYSEDGQKFEEDFIGSSFVPPIVPVQMDEQQQQHLFHPTPTPTPLPSNNLTPQDAAIFNALPDIVALPKIGAHPFFQMESLHR